ncbi:MAG: hypothetical protein ABIH76_06530 [Candidatus Bathyarchaeota archaeon]
MIDEVYSFTIPTYIKLLHHLRKHYQVIPLMKTTESKTPYLILRHDVDFSMEAAVRMAKIDYDAGIKATYSFLFSSNHYNLMERKALDSLLFISDLGHEVALHYDLKMYRKYKASLETSLKYELNLLERLTGKPVKSIIIHQFGLEQSDPFQNYPDIINGFNKELYDLYVSDSYRAWYREYLEKLFSFKYNRIQLLIHPSIWTDKPTIRSDVLRQIDALDFIMAWDGNPKIKENDLIKSSVG